VTTDRQIQILQYLNRHESVDIAALSDILQISASTVRREVAAMEESGLLVREHGSVRLPIPIRYELPFEARAAATVTAKRKIAARAAELVQPRQVIGMSGGTTVTELARQLRAHEEITVVTTAVNVAIELQGTPGKRVMVTGGILDQTSYELVGDLVTQALRTVHLDVVFQGVSGINADFGFSVADEPAAVVARALRDSADRVIVLADHTKLGQRSFVRAYGLAAAHTLITDDGITPAQRAELEAIGVRVLVAD
jgi:DeoR family transcriptional regulator of aga operon